MQARYCIQKGGLAALFYFLFSAFAFNMTHVKEASADVGKFSEQNLNIKIGQAIFEKLWVFSPSSTVSSDGLGPLYNARSCHQCHNPAKASVNNVPPSLVIQLSIEPKEQQAILDLSHQHFLKTGFVPEPTYGKQLQTFAFPGGNAEATISITSRSIPVQFPDKSMTTLQEPRYHFNQLGYGELHPDVRFSPRVASRLHGLALLEQIPTHTLLQLADADDLNNDGISGKINWVWDLSSNKKAIGRFGWKAGKPTLQQQNLAALSTDIGVSSWLFPAAEGDCSAAQTDCVELAKQTLTYTEVSLNDRGINSGEGPSHDSELLSAHSIEASKTMTDLLQLFTASSGPQQTRKTANRPTPNAGENLFNTIGCQHCHINQITLSGFSNNGTIATQISPYTDLLLHDMGDALSDNRQEFSATGKEWRTAPLWGMADYLKKAKEPRFLHDGRARSINEAILWHGGEAQKIKRAYMALSLQQRSQLIEFVESL